MKNFIKYFLLLYSISLIAMADKTAVLLSESKILNEASVGAEMVSILSKDSVVSLLRRRGGWYQVQTEENKIGWLRMLKVRFLSEHETNEKSIAKILRDTAIMPPASGVSTGVRGVSDEYLNQKGDQEYIDYDSPIRFEQLKNFVPTKESINEFAEQGELKNQESVVLPGN